MELSRRHVPEKRVGGKRQARALVDHHACGLIKVFASIRHEKRFSILVNFVGGER